MLRENLKLPKSEYKIAQPLGDLGNIFYVKRFKYFISCILNNCVVDLPFNGGIFPPLLLSLFVFNCHNHTLDIACSIISICGRSFSEFLNVLYSGQSLFPHL